MEGWRAHCALQMVQGLRRGRSGEGPEMDGLIMIGSLDTDPCSWVPSSTLDPQWRAKFTANGEISCDLSFSHVSFCLKKTKQTLLLLMSHGLILTSAYWLKSEVELQTWAPLFQQISHPWNVPGEAALLSIFHQTAVEQRQQITNPKITLPKTERDFFLQAPVCSLSFVFLLKLALDSLCSFDLVLDGGQE